VDGRMRAGHFGYVWRGLLMLGPPSIRLEDEQRSPAVILLSWIIQNAQSLGLKGFDLTIGDSDFKKRLGNHCVQLTMVEVHGSSARYHLQAARDGVVSMAKRVADRALGDGAWKGRVKPAVEELAFHCARLRQLGPAGALRDMTSAASRWIYDPGVERVYVLTTESVAAAAAPSLTACVRENSVEDLLRARAASPTIARAMTACARSYARLRNTGHTLHTLLVDDALAGWCYSSTAGLQDVFVLPGFSVAAATRLLRGAAAAQFSRGATQLRVTIAGEDSMLESAAAATGRLSAQTRTPRLFGNSRRLDRAARLWRRLTWRAVKRRIALALHYQAEERTYRLSRDEAAELPASDDFARDRWEDLDLFAPTEPRHVREDVLEDWRQRRVRGEHVYTRIEDGRLAAYGWVVERQKTAPLTWVKQTVDLPDHAAVIYDFYTLPEYRHHDFYQRLLMHAMQDAARMPDIQWICLSILASDRVPRWWVERIGMQYCASHFYRRILWWTTKWQQTSTPMRSNS
jgi:GNAT superfamily N-acetyltransferase